MTGSEIEDFITRKTLYTEATAESVTGTPGQGVIYYAADGRALYKTPKGVMWHGCAGTLLLKKHHLKQLKLPTFLAEYEKQAQDCARGGVDHGRYLLRLCELELIERERRTWWSDAFVLRGVRNTDPPATSA
jgi:hypothetical protein